MSVGAFLLSILCAGFIGAGMATGEPGFALCGALTLAALMWVVS